MLSGQLSSADLLKPIGKVQVDQAVKAFQKSQRLQTNGELNSPTLKKLIEIIYERLVSE